MSDNYWVLKTGKDNFYYCFLYDNFFEIKLYKCFLKYVPSTKNFVIWVFRILNLKIAVVDYFNFFLFLYFQWLVSLCRKMGLVYIRQVHVIGTILRMEVVQSDGKTKLCTVLCQFLDWLFKTKKKSHTLTYSALLLLIKTHLFFCLQ